MELEGRGIPSVGVATTEFTQAAQSQSQALGYEPELVFIPHPIQDRSDQELRDLADAAYSRIVAGIVASEE